MGHSRSTRAAVWVVHPPHGVIVRGTVRWGSSLSHSHIGCDTPPKMTQSSDQFKGSLVWGLDIQYSA